MTRPSDDHPWSSCDLSDACDRPGLDVVRTGVFRPLWPDCPPVGGLVTTVRLEPSTQADSPLRELLAVLERAAGGIVVVDLGGRVDVQCWGSLLTTAAARCGVRGALVNGAARDVEDLRLLGFPAYARGVHPAGMHGRLRLAATGEPVDVDGGRIEQGCFAGADASGAVFVPAERLDEIRTVAAGLRAAEEPRLAAIRAGADPRTVFDGTALDGTVVDGTAPGVEPSPS